jgi:hypothetical protein
MPLKAKMSNWKQIENVPKPITYNFFHTSMDWTEIMTSPKSQINLYH